MKKVLLTSIFAASIVSFPVLAAPLVVDVKGDQQDGGIITISGQGFGQFGGEVVSWDDFEAHSVGASTHGLNDAIGNKWTNIYDYSGKGAVIDSSRSVSGSKAVKIDWSIDRYGIRAFGWSGRGPYNKLYISYWRYMQGDYNHKEPDNHKQFYLYGNQKGFPQGMPLIPAGSTTWGFYNNIGDGSVSYNERNNINKAGWSFSNTVGKFQRWEWFVQLNEPSSESNGVIKGWVDGKLGISTDKYRVRNNTGEFVDFRLGHMAGGFEDSAKAWFDDLYIATTQARVEICDQSTWSQCSKKSIAVPIANAWSSSQIKVKLRGMKNMSQAYLYVVDQNGAVNELGYQLMSGGSPPVAPVLTVKQ